MINLEKKTSTVGKAEAPHDSHGQNIGKVEKPATVRPKIINTNLRKVAENSKNTFRS